jgi:shikimate dehydrogenase
VADLIYHETPLLNFAKKHGFDYVNGKDMLIYQGAKSFELWTDLKAPIELMKKAID